MPKKYQGNSAEPPSKDLFSRGLNWLIEKISPSDAASEASASHTIDFSRVPSGWSLYDFGQNPVHQLWNITLVTILPNGNADYVEVAEEDTPLEAFEKCIKLALEATNRDSERNEIPKPDGDVKEA